MTNFWCSEIIPTGKITPNFLLIEGKELPWVLLHFWLHLEIRKLHILKRLFERVGIIEVVKEWCQNFSLSVKSLCLFAVHRPLETLHDPTNFPNIHMILVSRMKKFKTQGTLQFGVVDGWLKSPSSCKRGQLPPQRAILDGQVDTLQVSFPSCNTS